MRPTTEEEKAQLVLELHGLCLRIPDKIRSASTQLTSASTQLTREWMGHQKWACKVAANVRSSVSDLEIAIRCMRSYL